MTSTQSVTMTEPSSPVPSSSKHSKKSSVSSISSSSTDESGSSLGDPFIDDHEETTENKSPVYFLPSPIALREPLSPVQKDLTKYWIYDSERDKYTLSTAGPNYEAWFRYRSNLLDMMHQGRFGKATLKSLFEQLDCAWSWGAYVHIFPPHRYGFSISARVLNCFVVGPPMLVMNGEDLDLLFHAPPRKIWEDAAIQQGFVQSDEGLVGQYQPFGKGFVFPSVASSSKLHAKKSTSSTSEPSTSASASRATTAQGHHRRKSKAHKRSKSTSSIAESPENTESEDVDGEEMSTDDQDQDKENAPNAVSGKKKKKHHWTYHRAVSQKKMLLKALLSPTSAYIPPATIPRHPIFNLGWWPLMGPGTPISPLAEIFFPLSRKSSTLASIADSTSPKEDDGSGEMEMDEGFSSGDEPYEAKLERWMEMDEDEFVMYEH